MTPPPPQPPPLPLPLPTTPLPLPAEIHRIRQEATRLETRYGYLRAFKDLRALSEENEELKRRCAVMAVTAPSPDTIGRILEAEAEAMVRNFEPFTEDDISATMEETYKCIESNLSDEAFIGEIVSRFQGLGWLGQRILQSKSGSDATLRVEVSKTFLKDSSRGLVDRAWAIISTTEGYRKLFCPHLQIKVTMLQRVNDDCVVIHRVLFDAKTGDLSRSVDMLCRVQRLDDTIIISRALPVDKLRHVVKDPAGWCSSINVLSFAPIIQARSNFATSLEEPAKRVGCDFTYRGFVRRQIEMPLRVWALEIILMMMRLETMIMLLAELRHEAAALEKQLQILQLTLMLTNLRQEAAMLEKELQFLQLAKDVRALTTESHQLQEQRLPLGETPRVSESGISRLLQAICEEAMARYQPVDKADFERDADELMDEFWGVVEDVDRFAQLSPAPVKSKVVQLERLSSDAFVVFRVSCHPRSGAIRRSVDLVERVINPETGSSCLVIQSLDAPHLRSCTDGPNDWQRAVVVLEFERRDSVAGRAGCGVHFRLTTVMAPNSALEWSPTLVEHLELLLRLEAAAISSPVFVT
ncbi:hypothetical protein ATCC90586_000782 [Pythium insidiosum]|nr:hypothetical protein ATCC90586_000782 [Pythium insidiosum]